MFYFMYFHIFSEMCSPPLGGKHIFEKRFSAKCLQKLQFWITFGCIGRFNPPPPGPLPPVKMLLPCGSWALLRLGPVLHSWFSSHFCYVSNLVKLFRFLFCMIFRLNFVIFMNMCSPPRQEAHFREPIFANSVCKAKFACPEWLQTISLGGGISVLSCWKNSSFRRLSGKGPSWEVQFSIACILACILYDFFIFSVLMLSLLFGRSV